MTTIIGQTSTAWVFSWSFFSTNNQAGTSGTYTAPSAGTAIQVVLWSGGAPASFVGMLWDASGNVIGQSNAITVSGQSWNTAPSNIALTSGQVFRVGWWRSNTAGFSSWRTTGSGNALYNTSASPGALTGTTTLNGDIGAYIVFNPTPPVPPAPPPTGVILLGARPADARLMRLVK